MLVEGRNLARFTSAELYEHRRRMGVLFQHGALFTDLSVYDNIAFPMRELTDLPEAVIRDLVLLKLNAVGLRGVEKLMPAELSGGMARRVALARTICARPRIDAVRRTVHRTRPDFARRHRPLNQPCQQSPAFNQRDGYA